MLGEPRSLATGRRLVETKRARSPAPLPKNPSVCDSDSGRRSRPLAGGAARYSVMGHPPLLASLTLPFVVILMSCQAQKVLRVLAYCEREREREKQRNCRPTRKPAQNPVREKNLKNLDLLGF